ncbi:MAG: hypothetical protein NC078_01350 [Ruminococcus sp.]|nr:hypothetical protein [Ruminococcus sp.]
MIPLEIERKFLIEGTSEVFEKCAEKITILQIYLTRSDPDIQRRIRSWETAGEIKYFYTEKRFISPAVREENEREISREEFENLKSQADPDLAPIEKVRRILPYEGQSLEIDSYSFEPSLATMELELDSEDREIIFPPFVNIIKEVTGDKDYSNASLALKGFPLPGGRNKEAESRK